MSNATTTHPALDDPTAFVFYRYHPSKSAAIIFATLFLLTTLLHVYQMRRTKAWYFTPFIIGGIFETVGYIGREISSKDQWALTPYLVQTLTLLVAPALFAASIYMVLGRIILLTHGERFSILPKRWLTKVFVCGDVLSFLFQAGGGGLMSSGTLESLKIGEKIVVVGLFVQLTFFSFFLVTATVFHRRFNKFGSSATTLPSPIGRSWARFMTMLYITSGLIMARSLFRVVEYLQGNAGALLRHEVYVYIFDGCLMVAAMCLLNWRHPGDFTKLGEAVEGEELDFVGLKTRS